jgi:hypothetical protein
MHGCTGLTDRCWHLHAEKSFRGKAALRHFNNLLQRAVVGSLNEVSHWATVARDTGANATSR